MDQQTVTNACLKDGGKLLKSNYKQAWSTENPTLGYCYIVSEALYHYEYPDHKACVLNLGKCETHWFLAPNTPGHILGHFIVDFTADQFKGFDVTRSYPNARGCGFFKGSVQTERGFISKHGYAMAKLLGLVEEAS